MISAFFDVRVAHKALEATDICMFELVSTEGVALPSFSAGSHIDVEVPGGAIRQYSLCNNPDESHRYVICVLKESSGRGGSRAMHETVHTGDVIRISPPKNHFQLANGAARSLLFAGGIGITPILCMAERLETVGSNFEMHYCVRSMDRTAFKKRIEDSGFASKVNFHYDDAPAGQRIDIGVTLDRQDPDTHLYVCGPKGFMDAVLEEARSRGWAEERLHYEFFSADVAPSTARGGFEVKLASSGVIVTVPEDKTVVQALADIDVTIATSCEQGVCGTCVTRVLEGEIDHRDVFLTPSERAANDRFTPCCSRAKSRMLVLDL